MNGTQDLIALADEAVAAGSTEQIVNRLRTGLCDLINSGEVRLPARVLESNKDHYARRLLHQDEGRGYSIVAMTWGAGQGTPIHDHAGLWCVEGVFKGSIEVQQYELMQREEARYRFEPRGSFQAGIGSAGCLIPPHEYHSIRNAGSKPAVSVHIYGGEMNSCSVFEPASDGWFVRYEKTLGLDV
jgi:predicted metal-dependent enzyme (double-stranded beta helix superfamily)